MADFVPPRITATIVGNVVAPAESKFDGALTELRVAVGSRRKNKDTGEYEDGPTTWVTYKASNEYGTPLKAFGKGDRVRITDANLEAREYAKKDGSTGLALDARFGEVELLESKSAPATESPW